MPPTYLRLGDNATPANNVLLRANDDGTLSICTGSPGGETERFKFLSSGVMVGCKPPTITKLLSGTGTYTTPSGCVRLRIRMVGGGSGGQSFNVASNGGNTTFGTASLLLANGGNGTTCIGGNASIFPPAFGIAIKGEDGESGRHQHAVGVWASGGKGGCTPFGGGGHAGIAIAGGVAAVNSGSGGGGSSAGDASSYYGGFGGAAGGYIDAVINNPAASYPYAVGARGNGAAAAGGQLAGGHGSLGLILIEEYYV